MERGTRIPRSTFWPPTRRTLRRTTVVSRPPAPPSFAVSDDLPSTSLERIRTVIVADHDELGGLVAGRIAELIRERAASGKPAVLGLATGSTPIGVYRELIRMHREEGLGFAHVVTFNLDEYYPMDPGSVHSYHRFMWENLFSQLDIRRENVHIPRGDLPRGRVDEDAGATRRRSGRPAASTSSFSASAAPATSGSTSRGRGSRAAPGSSPSIWSPEETARRISSARRTSPARRSRWAWPPSSRRARS